jgi:hypothetical protein
VESVSVDQGRIRFLGSFACPSLEQAFRRTHLRDDLRLGRGCAIVAVAGSVVFLVGGYRVYGTSAHFLVLLVSRGVVTLACLGLILALRRCQTTARGDRLLTLGCLIVAVGNLTILATRSSGNLGHALMSLGVPLVTYCILPLPLVRQLLLAIPFSLAALLVALGTGVESTALFSLAGAYLIANGIGWFASWQLQHLRRQAYLAGVRERELRRHLEQALAEVKTLRGLISICAWCKRIRNEDQAWQPLESYVQSHSHAEFSHGICDRCVREQIGEAASAQV